MQLPQPTEKLEEDVEKRFDDELLSEDVMAKGFYHWKAIDEHGEVDIVKIKQFLAQELSKQRKEDFEKVAFWIEQGTFDYVEMKVKQELESLTKGTK